MVGFPSDGPSPVPFPAIVGQERLKRALLAVSVNDAIDGLLIRGEKGTAKSTAVRALVDLLPTQAAVADCPYGCPPDEPAAQCESCRARTDPPVEERSVPLVTVPLGATRERIVGSLSVTDALDGEANFEPGLLARANRGFLYVDEVNLLDDHLVDVLLDAAASGHNRVERDGMSVTHPADFTLLGTMNPEEGDLRPQLRDRFAIQATVEGSEDINERVEIIETALERDATRKRDATGKGNATSNTRASGYEPAIENRRKSIREARDRLARVTLPTEFKETIATVCTDAGVDGHRGDIAAARTALAFAALDGRSQVIETDVREALSLSLPHRLQSRPFEESADLEDILEDHFDDPDPTREAEQEAQNAEDADQGDNDGGTDAEPETQPDSSDAEPDVEGERPGDPDGKEGQRPPDQNAQGERAEGDPTAQNSKSGGSATEAQRSRAEIEPDQNSDGAEETSDRSGGENNRTGSAGNEEDQTGSTDDSETVRPSQPAHRPAPVGTGTETTLDLDEDPGTVSEPIHAGRVDADPSPEAIGPRVRTEPAESPENIDAAASIREAAKNGRSTVDSRDLRQSVNAGTSTALVVFAVDASASMRPAIEAAKGTVMELLKEAYQERDEVAFVAFAGDGAEVLLPPTDSVTLAARHLKELPTGDRTPLPAGLDTVRDVIDRAEPAASVAVVVTDGRTNVADGSPTKATRSSARALGAIADQVLVVDAGKPDDTVGLIAEIVDETDGRVIPLEELSTDSVTEEMYRARE